MRLMLSLLVGVALNCMLCLAVPPAVQWEKQYGPGAAGEAGWAVIQTSDGGYAVAAVSDFLDAWGDFMLLRLDANGDTLWTKFYSDPTGLETPRGLFQKPDLGFVIGGQHDDLSAAAPDFRLVETDAAGNLVGTHTYANPNYDLCADMIATADGGAVFVGTRDVLGTMQAHVLKVGSTWTVDWSATHHCFPTGANLAEDIRQIAGGGFAIAGTFQNPDSTKIFLATLSGSGALQWAVLMDPFGTEWGYCLEYTGSGYVIGGMADSGGPDFYDACLIGTDAAGTVLWSGLYGGADFDNVQDLSATFDGGYVATGYNIEGLDDYTYILKTDGGGAEYWNVLLGGASTDAGHSVRPTADGGYVVTGLRARPDAEDQNIYIVKLQPDQPLPVELTTFDAQAVAAGIEIAFTTATETNTDYFEIMRSAGDEFTAVARLAGAGNSTVERGYVYVDGAVSSGTRYHYFLSAIDLDGQRHDFREQTRTLDYDMNSALPGDFTLTAYPNPFNPETTIEFSLPEQSVATVKVFDVTGREVRTLADHAFTAGTQRVKFNAGELPSGLYVVQARMGARSALVKVMLLK